MFERRKKAGLVLQRGKEDVLCRLQIMNFTVLCGM